MSLVERGRLAAAVAALTFLGASSCGAGGGDGGSTSGGAGRAGMRVTTLADSGPGSLRDAVSQGDRMVVFDVAGTISLQSALVIGGSSLTIDGTSAPSPGITLRDAGILIDGAAIHDVRVQNLRVRSPGRNYPEGDGITVKNGAHHVVIDHVSVDGCADGNIDITRGAHDVTVQWSVLSNCNKNMLINYQAQRLSIHHNLFVDSRFRNPDVSYTDEFTPNVSPGTTADVSNNLVWNWGRSGGGTILQCGAKVNVVANFYSSPGAGASRQSEAILDDGCGVGSGALIFASGNVSNDGLPFDLNRVGNQPRPFPGGSAEVSPACVAAHEVLAGAGAAPRDAVDAAHLGRIALPSC